jgi:hypothetical protein
MAMSAPPNFAWGCRGARGGFLLVLAKTFGLLVRNFLPLHSRVTPMLLSTMFDL